MCCVCNPLVPRAQVVEEPFLPPLTSSRELGGVEAGFCSSEDSLIPPRLCTAASAAAKGTLCSHGLWLWVSAGCSSQPFFYNNALAAGQLLPHSLKWGLRSFDYLALTTLGACHRAGSAPPLATAALLLLCHWGPKLFQETHHLPGLALGGSPKSFPPWGSHTYLRHQFYTLNLQHSGVSGSWDLNPAPMSSSCFGAAQKIRIALTFSNGQK